MFFNIKRFLIQLAVRRKPSIKWNLNKNLSHHFLEVLNGKISSVCFGYECKKGNSLFLLEV
jgi:hypothetical protein